MMHWFQITDFFVFNTYSLLCKIFGHKQPPASALAFTFYFCPRCAKMFYWNRRKEKR